jgi:ubiquinone/menaquinone biosynthesis C-methylase UbiE
MPDHHEVYHSEADQYERLVAREDMDGNILKAIRQIVDLRDLAVVETGAGTGRLTCLLAGRVHTLHAYDASEAMLTVARRKLDVMGNPEITTTPADHRHLPEPECSADLLISGWSVCYLVDWNRADWRAEVQAALDEFKRILRPGGTIILIETQGTGFETATPPEHLVEYYRFLADAGFESDWFRTDYLFESVDEAIELAGFFFGEEMAARIRTDGSRVLPECTGIWWRRIE